MASLTPGDLAKLLSGAGGGEIQHRRSTLLQVIEIVPSTCASDNATWPSPARGFFLKLSDSANAAYVSISDHADVELVRSKAVRLGQFVHVARVDTATPVPELRGLSPVPIWMIKPCPCIGNPVDLVSSEALCRNSDSSQRSSWDTRNVLNKRTKREQVGFLVYVAPLYKEVVVGIEARTTPDHRYSGIVEGSMLDKQECTKGVPWTENEHKMFLMGLKTYGKGDWKRISRKCVVTKTPTQVASHAQKYFIRQCSDQKNKSRPSIHDMNLYDSTLMPPPPQ